MIPACGAITNSTDERFWSLIEQMDKRVLKMYFIGIKYKQRKKMHKRLHEIFWKLKKNLEYLIVNDYHLWQYIGNTNRICDRRVFFMPSRSANTSAENIFSARSLC